MEGPQREAAFYFRATQVGAVTVTGDGVSAEQAQTVL
jgi:hypothetical protein